MQDIRKADVDYKTIYGFYGLYESLRDKNGKFGKLTQEQETSLKELQDEYGENSDIFDEDFKQLLKLYRQRQEYEKQNPKSIKDKINGKNVLNIMEKLGTF